MARRKAFPKEVLIYVFEVDKETGVPIYSVAESVNEIPEDCAGALVGIYTLSRTSSFKVRRELK